MRKILNRQFIKFIFVGILNTIVGYGSFSLFVFFRINYVIANTLSTILGVINSYLLNKKITFKNNKIRKTTPLKFVTVYIISYIISTINLMVLVRYCNTNTYFAGFINLIMTTMISWFGHKYFSFKERVVR